MRARLTLVFLLAASTLAVAPAAAAHKRKPRAHQPPVHKATLPVTSPARVEDQRHYDRGVELFEHGDYHAAVVEFELVSMPLPNKPALDYQIARSLDRSGQLRGALSHYRAFVASAPADANVAEARKRIDELTPEVARDEQAARARAPEPVESSSETVAPVSSTPAALPATPAREYVLGITKGVSAPVAAASYANGFDVGYVAGLRFAVDFRLRPGMLLGPVVEIDGLPLNSSAAEFPVATANASLGRVRGTAGAELRLPTRYLELWVRAMVGVDAVVGSIKYTDTMMKVTYSHVRSTAFGFVPQLGWSVPVSSRVGVGLGFGLPLALDHRIGKGAAATNELDVEISAALDVRL